MKHEAISCYLVLDPIDFYRVLRVKDPRKDDGVCSVIAMRNEEAISMRFYIASPAEKAGFAMRLFSEEVYYMI
jgi:hypothetical protein